MYQFNSCGVYIDPQQLSNTLIHFQMRKIGTGTNAFFIKAMIGRYSFSDDRADLSDYDRYGKNNIIGILSEYHKGNPKKSLNYLYIIAYQILSISRFLTAVSYIP